MGPFSSLQPNRADRGAESGNYEAMDKARCDAQPKSMRNCGRCHRLPTSAVVAGPLAFSATRDADARQTGPAALEEQCMHCFDVLLARFFSTSPPPTCFPGGHLYASSCVPLLVRGAVTLIAELFLNDE